ncbi:SDR family oxidoreductase [Bacillus aryabhattai]|nr:SDR family oxidoreductase [Priestia aryabhattai]
MINKQVALVLGASQGIGRAVALELAQEGYSLIINARSESTLKDLMNEINDINLGNHMVFQGDVTEKNVRDDLFLKIKETYGRLDILINNIPGGVPDTFQSYDPNVTVNAFSKKAITYFDCMKNASSLMERNQYGRIINLVGNLWKEPAGNMFTNSLINASIINASKNISRQFAEKKITVNCINPGFIKTDRYYKYIDNLITNNGISREEAEAAVAEDIPSKRVGDPQEVSSLIAYLCSEKAAYVTGQQISVDGGTLRSL